MKYLLILVAFVTSSYAVKIYTPQHVHIQINEYDRIQRYNLPNSIENIDALNDLHLSYAITASIEKMDLNLWRSYVSDQYFDNIGLSMDELEQALKDENEPTRTQSLVYDVQVVVGDEKYSILLITGDVKSETWYEGIDLVAANFIWNSVSEKWKRTTLGPDHILYKLPLFNLVELRKLLDSGAMIVDEQNIPRFLDSGAIKNFNRIMLGENK